MDDMEQKLNSILGNPEMMGKIMSLAQSFGQQKQEAPPAPPQQAPSMPNIDPAMLQKIAGFMQHSGIDRNQQALLKALKPYLSAQRLSKLEKAMRAARVASFASTALGSGGLFQLGR